ncbi:hypothetical protein BV898_19154 [Hypsibius exemplaris]|uniref:Uncharacterized protein n=1 Tax=Hypsibius exemplaris TaxID=2072580 RepID=A0A9X6RP58_HYPEX|nr:hypothetical protein BV898_19154 [Hypsibius exemplaris]
MTTFGESYVDGSGQWSCSATFPTENSHVRGGDFLTRTLSPSSISWDRTIRVARNTLWREAISFSGTLGCLTTRFVSEAVVWSNMRPHDEDHGEGKLIRLGTPRKAEECCDLLEIITAPLQSL